MSQQGGEGGAQGSKQQLLGQKEAHAYVTQGQFFSIVVTFLSHFPQIFIKRELKPISIVLKIRHCSSNIDTIYVPPKGFVSMFTRVFHKRHFKKK